MPGYTLNHIHHEAADVHAATAFYQNLFGATTEPPFERAGATWLRVHIGDIVVTITDRQFSTMELGRYQGLDHLALTTNDFDATLADIKRYKIDIWSGPIDIGNDQRMVFVNGPDHVKIEILEQA